MNRALLPALLAASGLLVGVPAASAGPEAPPGEAPSADRAENGDLPGHAFVIAGRDASGYSGDGGMAVDARLNDRLQLDVAPDGTVYVADRSNKRVRVITPDGMIDTLEGTRARRSPETDGIEVPGIGTYSPSNTPIATAVGPDGSVYVAGADDIRRVAPDGTVTVLAGAGEDRIEDGDPDGGAAADASMHEPNDIAVDADGNVYVADTDNNRVRRIDPDGVITTVAGGGEDHPASAEGRQGSKLKTYSPQYVEVDSQGSVYFTLELDGSVFEIEPDGTLRVIGGEKFAQLQEGMEPTDAADTGGRRMALDADDNLYVTDLGNGRLRRLGAEDNMIVTVGPLPSSTQDIAVGADGDVYYTAQSRVWRVPDPTAELPSADPVEPAESPWPDEEPGTVHTVAGVGGVPDEVPEIVTPSHPAEGPSAVAAGPDGVTYVVESLEHVIHRVDPDGTVSTLAGTGESGFAGDGGPATAAQLSHPAGLDVDADGNVYVADSNNAKIRRIDTDGVITTVVGADKPDGGDDETGPVCEGEPATEAILSYPVDVAVGADGGVYLADATRGLVCSVSPDGLLTAVAGGGELWMEDADDEPAVQASLWEPNAIDVDAEGNVYLIERGHPYVRMVRSDGVLVAVAGDSYYGLDEGGFAGDGGPAAEAELNTPSDLSAAPDGGLYVADTFNSRIRHIDTDGVIDTVAGTGSRHVTGDGGPATEAELNEPDAIDVTPDGTIVVGGTAGDLVRRIDTNGTIDTLADFSTPEPADEPTTEAELSGGMSIAVGPDGTLVIGEPKALRLRTVDGDVLTDVPVAQEQLAQLGRMATGPGGELYAIVGETVARVYPDGRLVTVAGGAPGEEQVFDGALPTTQVLAPTDIAVDSAGLLYVLDHVQKAVYQVRPDRSIHAVDGFDDITLEQPGGVAVNPGGTVYVTDTAAHEVFSVAPDGAVEKFAGTGAATADDNGGNGDGGNGDGGPATDAVINEPGHIVADDEGNVFIATSDGVRQVASDGTITTALERKVEGGSISPGATALGPGGDLYVVDGVRRQVLAVVRPGAVAGPFPWLPVGLAAGGLVVVGAVVVLPARRRRGSARREESEQAQSPAGSPDH